MKIEKLKTSKLFYNKWLYRIEVRVPGGSAIRVMMHRRITDINGIPSFYYKQYSDLQKNIMVKFVKEMLAIPQKEFRMVVSGNQSLIFCSSKKILETLKKNLEPHIINVKIPFTTKETKFIIENKNKKRICETLPHKKYHYRVQLSRLKPDVRESFGKWIVKYPDKLKASPDTLRWLQSSKSHCSTPFMYIEDGAMLAMVGLFLGDGVKSIEEFILRSSINT